MSVMADSLDTGPQIMANYGHDGWILSGAGPMMAMMAVVTLCTQQ